MNLWVEGRGLRFKQSNESCRAASLEEGLDSSPRVRVG